MNAGGYGEGVLEKQSNNSCDSKSEVSGSESVGYNNEKGKSLSYYGESENVGDGRVKRVFIDFLGVGADA